MSFESVPFILITTFLALAGVYHLAAPSHSAALLSRRGSIQLIGAVLSVLGGWALLKADTAALLVGIPVLLSGLARFLAADMMIKLNTWTSRYVHGVLMLIGAALCAFLRFGLVNG